MAKKLSPAELKAQGAELSKQIADIRKKNLNFAMVMGKDSLVFCTDPKKNCDILWRTAKKEAGGAKGAKGVVSMSGKVMVLDADDPDSVPGPLLKAAKKHFSDRGVPIRIMLKDVEEEKDEDQADAEEEKPQKKDTAIDAEAQEEETPKKDEAAEDETVEDETKEVAVEEEETRDGEDEPAPETSQSDGTEETEKDDQGDALRTQLMSEFKALKPDLDLVRQTENAGLKKKVAAIAKMFVDQVKTDLKKANAALGLLQTTIKSAKDDGQLAAEKEQPDNRASDARRKKLAALERGVDKLLERLG